MPEAARVLYEETVRVQRQLGPGPGLGLALRNLTMLSATRNDLAAAEAFLAETLVLSREMSDKVNAGYALVVSVEIARARKQWQRAARLSGAVGAMCREIGSGFPPSDEADWQQAQQEIRAALGASLFEAEATIGGTWGWEEAVRVALTGSLPP